MIHCKISKALNALKSRIYYVKKYKKGFHVILLLPGKIRDLIGDHSFFKTLIKNETRISIDDRNKDRLLLQANNYDFIFPRNCFYEGDFFDIIYPNLHINNTFIQSCIYDNPFYESKGVYEKFGFNYLSAPMGSSGHFGCDLWMLKKLD